MLFVDTANGRGNLPRPMNHGHLFAAKQCKNRSAALAFIFNAFPLALQVVPAGPPREGSQEATRVAPRAGELMRLLQDDQRVGESR